MRAPETFRIPRIESLRSNKLEDIKNLLGPFFDQLDRLYRLLWQDISEITIDSDGWIYFGEQNTDGTWRIGREGDNWVGQRRESGVWTPSKGKITA